MNWKAIARSEIGTSHIKQQLSCQDYSDYKILNDAIIGVVADGAGSAKHSDIGAKLAVDTVLTKITEEDIQKIIELCNSPGIDEAEKSKSFVLKPLSLFSRSKKNSDAAVAVIESDSKPEVKQFFSNIVKQVTIALEKQAETNGYEINDLACTLLIAIATPQGIAAMQIGDGFIAVRYPQKDPELLFSPDKGEYVNETTFVTSTNALEDMEVVIKSGQPKFICASTDGLERLAIRLSDCTPFTPFFQPLEQYLRETENLDSDRYIEDFLNSDRLNARTDDDKTLFLCLYDQSDPPE